MPRKSSPALKRRVPRPKHRQETKITTEPRAPIPPAKLRALIALVQRHRDDDRMASWELGQLASKLLGHTETTPSPRLIIADLAEQIGLIKAPDPASPGKRRDESNLRQLMKFGRLATKRQASALHKTGVAWRGIVYWLGVNDDGQRDKLYREMVRGLTNSTEIRVYIETALKKKPLPRFSGDCAGDFKKAQNQADSLTSVLHGLCRSVDRHEDCGPARQRRQLTKALEKTRKQINATMRKMRKRA